MSLYLAHPAVRYWNKPGRLRPDHQIAIIVASAYGLEAQVTALMAGLAVDNFIRKPFHIDDLVTLLKDSALAHASSMHSA